MERSAGGGAGPMGRRLGGGEMLGEELRERFRDGGESSSSSALRLQEECDGSVGSMFGMACVQWRDWRVYKIVRGSIG